MSLTKSFSTLWNPPCYIWIPLPLPSAVITVPPMRLDGGGNRLGGKYVPPVPELIRQSLWQFGKFFVPASLLLCPGGDAGFLIPRRRRAELPVKGRFLF